jgi:hypothetical protein
MTVKQAAVVTFQMICLIFFMRFGLYLGADALNLRIFILGLVGGSGVLLFCKEGLIGYWTYATLMIGLAGLLSLSGSFVGRCEEAGAFCALHGNSLSVGLSFAYYVGCLALGWFGWRIARREAQR